MRGIDVRIIVPHIPDKKLVFEMTRCFYKRLMKAGVKIYEYEPGFIHAKCYLADDETAMIGTINLDYRSLAHHFENGLWMYKCDLIEDIKRDFADTFDKSIARFSVCSDPAGFSAAASISKERTGARTGISGICMCRRVSSRRRLKQRTV